MPRHDGGDDLLHALQSYAIPLFDRQRVIGRLKFDERPAMQWLKMHVRLEMERRWLIDADFVAEPAEARLLIRIGIAIEQLLRPLEAGGRLRHPDAPDQLVVEADDRDLQTSSDEEVLVDDTEVRRQLAARFPLGLRNVIPVGGRLECPVERQGVELLAAAGACPGVLHGGTAPKPLWYWLAGAPPALRECRCP